MASVENYLRAVDYEMEREIALDEYDLGRRGKGIDLEERIGFLRRKIGSKLDYQLLLDSSLRAMVANELEIELGACIGAPIKGDIDMELLSGGTRWILDRPTDRLQIATNLLCQEADGRIVRVVVYSDPVTPIVVEHDTGCAIYNMAQAVLALNANILENENLFEKRRVLGWTSTC